MSLICRGVSGNFKKELKSAFELSHPWIWYGLSNSNIYKEYLLNQNMISRPHTRDQRYKVGRIYTINTVADSRLFSNENTL